jgi:hypothetical protein
LGYYTYMNNTNTNAAMTETINGTTIDFSDAAISLLNWGDRGTVGIVRPTTSGQFAVIELLGGGRKRVAKVLPTVARDRAYNYACSGQ